MHVQDGLGRSGLPGLQALQELHAAQTQGQGARVGGHVLVQRPGVEDGDVGVWQQARRMQGQRQAHRPSAHHRNPPSRM